MSRLPEVELRAAVGLSLPSPGRLVGYAAVFDAPADLGEFSETIKPGAFSRALSQSNNILALYDHERRSVLGRTGSGTLKLAEDAKGLQFELTLPDTQLGRDLAVLVQRGDVSGCSFGFLPYPDGDRWEYRGERLHRELTAVDVREITITPTPAYSDTTVTMRSLQRAGLFAPSNARRWLETIR